MSWGVADFHVQLSKSTKAGGRWAVRGRVGGLRPVRRSHPGGRSDQLQGCFEAEPTGLTGLEDSHQVRAEPELGLGLPESCPLLPLGAPA